MTTEAFSRVKIDKQLADVGWPLTDGRSVRYEVTLSDGTRADYILSDRNGRALAVVEAKRTSVDPAEGEDQGRRYAELLGVPLVFLANGEQVRVWEPAREAHPHAVRTFYSQEDLERREAARALKLDPLTIAIDGRIVEREYQIACIDTLCRQLNHGRRKLLVEMATGTGKTRTAAALIKRLFDANQVTRVLFVVDRNTLAKQAEDAFAEHLTNIPAYWRRPGARFQDEKRVTVMTLQTLQSNFRDLSSGYFDLILIDECHRSIYGEWRRALDHIDAIKIGLTATPCAMRNAPDADEEDKATVRDTLRFFEVDEPTFTYRLSEAIEDGHLVPYEIYRALTVKTAAEGGFEVRRDEIDWAALEPEVRKELEAAFGDSPVILIDPSALERTFTIPERNRAIVREFRQVLENGYTTFDGLRRAPDWGKTIVFAVNKRHAQTLALMFDEVFADKKPSPEVRYADFVVSGVSAQEDTADAPGKIKRFKKEAFPQILVSVNMLDTGFDHPETVNLVMARFTKGSILYQQMRGRGTRKADHIGKRRFTMWDFTGVTAAHGDEEGLHEGGLVVVSERKPDPYGRASRKLITLDVHDEIDPSTREWVVADLDDAARVDADAAWAEALGAAFEAWLADDGPFDADALRLLRMVKQQIMANGAAIEAFESWRFDRAPFDRNGGFDRAVQALGGEEELEAALRRMNEAVFDDAAAGRAGTKAEAPSTSRPH